MTSPPYDGSRQAARGTCHGGPGVHGLPTGFPALLTSWLDSPYQGFRQGCRCPSGDLTAPGSWSVHGRRATDRRRGTDPLADRRRTRRVKAGVRTLSGKRAGGGLRTGQAPGAGEATPTHAPARPPWSRAGVVELRSPARPAPHRTRALSQHRHKADSPACGASETRPGGPGPPVLDDFPPSPVFGPGARAGFGMRKDRHSSRAERHFRHDFDCQPAFHPANPPDGYPAGNPAPQTCRRTCRPRPGRRRRSATEYTCGRGPG